jgi:hypothetical protein
VRQHLTQLLPTVSVRGKGAARFVFAEAHGRAVEASINDGNWWIECWESGDDDSPAAFQVTVTEDSDAIDAISEWLASK